MFCMSDSRIVFHFGLSLNRLYSHKITVCYYPCPLQTSCVTASFPCQMRRHFHRGILNHADYENGFDPKVSKKTESIHTVIFLPLYESSLLFTFAK